MKSPIVGIRIAAFVFGLICLGQLIRLLTGAEVLVADHALPLWPSALAVVIAGSLCLWLWKLSYRVAK